MTYNLTREWVTPAEPDYSADDVMREAVDHIRPNRGKPYYGGNAYAVYHKAMNCREAGTNNEARQRAVERLVADGVRGDRDEAWKTLSGNVVNAVRVCWKPGFCQSRQKEIMGGSPVLTDSSAGVDRLAHALGLAYIMMPERVDAAFSSKARDTFSRLAAITARHYGIEYRAESAQTPSVKAPSLQVA